MTETIGNSTIQADGQTASETAGQLAMETTGKGGSIAILVAGRVVHQVVLPQRERTARVLTGELERTVAWANQSGIKIGLLSVADGPGSFTGLRIGVTTAKTLSYAWQIPLVSVDSLSAIAAEAFRMTPNVDRILVALDAYREQAYVAEVSRQLLSTTPSEMAERIEVLSHSELASRVASAQGWHFAGDAKLFDDVDAARILPRECDAVGVGIIAHQKASQELFVEAMELVPRYVKLSAAEEKL
ncbi:tRNA threonylcarbamoyladenosine biosynthesis protein TsaB [Rubripirellula amarantea]|uniref:tRNA threonylcarbamoyladenosine biosynthesis protein TsaB n=1 Tax=Rubripirellula amarantea TaxID=2527999 RepID=A0A5C5WIB5_9BACT|nr:tRNA (adenosine(37)-N6)-threonylcarbamoyltransferase complex dimerization subunit type 1 TsaB [Rubripirellula amarantea]TWT50307.1 tRNA threonylcarbamoyladenosine biosynthesis protein TsaB [Rubripirellula amarantea]